MLSRHATFQFVKSAILNTTESPRSVLIKHRRCRSSAVLLWCRPSVRSWACVRASLGSVADLCGVSVFVCVCVPAVSGGTAVSLQRQLDLELLNDTLQTLPRLLLLLELLPQLLPVGLRLLELHVQLLNLQSNDRRAEGQRWYRYLKYWLNTG